MTSVYSSPRAFVKIENQIAGYVRNLIFSENIQRVNVQGLGNLLIKEVPPISLQCQFTVDQFFLDFKQPVVEAMMHRLGSVQSIVDTLVLGELGFSLTMYAKTVTSRDDTSKMVTQSDPTGETICQLGPCFVNNQQFSIGEQGVAGFNVSGIYLNPISTLNL